ncbi:unnamed protein product [Gadus morhua 'NCC']
MTDQSFIHFSCLPQLILCPMLLEKIIYQEFTYDGVSFRLSVKTSLSLCPCIQSLTSGPSPPEVLYTDRAATENCMIPPEGEDLEGSFTC